MTDKLYPILASYDVDKKIRAYRNDGLRALIIGIPWAMIQPHEKQAQRNHGQSLARLAERGGLGASEALAVLEDRPWHLMSEVDAHRRLAEMMQAADLVERDSALNHMRRSLQEAEALNVELRQALRVHEA